MNTTIERLELYPWSGGDMELMQLGAMKKLRRLYLQDTQVTAAGAEDFHKRRPDVAITGEFNIAAEPVRKATNSGARGLERVRLDY